MPWIPLKILLLEELCAAAFKLKEHIALNISFEVISEVVDTLKVVEKVGFSVD